MIYTHTYTHTHTHTYTLHTQGVQQGRRRAGTTPPRTPLQLLSRVVQSLARVCSARLSYAHARRPYPGYRRPAWAVLRSLLALTRWRWRADPWVERNLQCTKPPRILAFFEGFCADDCTDRCRDYRYRVRCSDPRGRCDCAVGALVKQRLGCCALGDSTKYIDGRFLDHLPMGSKPNRPSGKVDHTGGDLCHTVLGRSILWVFTLSYQFRGLQ